MEWPVQVEYNGMNMFWERITLCAEKSLGF